MRILLLLSQLATICWCHFEISECFKTRSCVYVPTGCQTNNVCRQVLSYDAKEDGWIDFELFSTMDTKRNNYMAIGFSTDGTMGDDAVTHCAFPDSGNPEVHVTYNRGKVNIPANATEIELEKNNLQLVHAHKDEKAMYCSFRQKSVKGASALADLSQPRTFFLARGKIRNPRAMTPHSFDSASPDFPFISEDEMDFSKMVNWHSDEFIPETTTVKHEPMISKSTRVTLARFHGVLMVISWLFLVAVAIVSSRYLRDHFPTSTPMGIKWWFHIHRTFNYLAVVLILVSTLLILIARNFTWKGPSFSKNAEKNMDAGSIHSLLGTIAVLLAVLQPLMALMRCAPDTGARPIFNWTHRTVGVLAFILALVATLIAANRFATYWKDMAWSIILVAFYIVVVIIVIISLEVLSYLKTKNNSKTKAMEMRSRTQRFDDNGRMITNVRVINAKPMRAIAIVFVLFALFAAVLVGLLLYLLFSSPQL